MNYIFYDEDLGNVTPVRLIYYVEPEPEVLANSPNYFTVESVPEPESIDGKYSVMYCNPSTQEIRYEYHDRPLTVEEELENLKQLVADLASLQLEV